MKPQHVFYHYNSSFDPVTLVEQYALHNLEPTPGYVTNAFGVLIDPQVLPHILTDESGVVEPLPIPANWHADLAEFGAALRAVDLASNTFSMMELGCGWGCWMNITGVVAKRKGLGVRLIGVEGDQGHVGFATRTLKDNGFRREEYSLYHGVAAIGDGVALFPKQDNPGSSWGLEPLVNLTQARADKLARSGKYDVLKQYSLAAISNDSSIIDLLHVDIQGGEMELIPSAIDWLSEKVSYLIIGTHSRQIEGAMFDCLLKAGWALEIERPSLLTLKTGAPVVSVDGVQGWRNPRLLPVVKVEKPKGRLKLLTPMRRIGRNDAFNIRVRIENNSGRKWPSSGPHPVNLSYHWKRRDGSYVVFNGQRTKLEGNGLDPSETREQIMGVVAPSSAGEFHLQLTMVEEGLAWFEESNFESDVVKLKVL